MDKYVLGLDIGINNVGYGLIEKETGKIITAGVRLFREANKNGNEERRGYRCTRRQIRRKQHRLERIKICFEKYGIKTGDVSDNPYLLRKRAIYEKVELNELAAALLHLAKRRGTTLDIPENEENGSELSTKDQVQKNNAELKQRFICELQLERIENGGVRGHKNKFRHEDYIKEAEAIINNQRKYHSEITDEFANEYMDIFKSRRMYFDGPGSEKSPTPYGQFFYDENGKLKHIGMIEKMKGKCTIFPAENRIAKMTYTADLFNLLNDFNNISFDDLCLSEQDKRYLVSEYVSKGKNITPTILKKYIVKNYGVDESAVCGFRIDMKTEKEQLTTFDGYKKYRKYAENAGLGDDIADNIELADGVIEILTDYKDFKSRQERLEKLLSEYVSAGEVQRVIDAFIDDTDFKGYHALSRAAIESILPELWTTNENQMQLFTEKGFFKKQNNASRGKSIVFDDTAILSTVARRSHREAIKIINKIREIYGEPDSIVIEMAREKNSDEQRENLRKFQKQQGDFEKEIKRILEVDDLKALKLSSKQWTALKLWKEQDGKCIYSHEGIKIDDIIYHFSKFEIDHIIPLSLSFDDSLKNKVLCYAFENQKKAQRTPFEYLISGGGKISFDEFKAEVLRLYKGDKRKNLLEMRDIKFNEELRKAFINRNLVDTRYACRSLRKTLSDYYSGTDTKIICIRGSFTAAFRKAAGIKKDRDESYAHHAVDALIVASMTKIPSFTEISQYMLHENMVVDKETFEIMPDSEYYDRKTLSYINALNDFKDIKFSHKVDRKINRAIMGKQTIYSTRVKDGSEYIVNKYSDIYSLSKDDCKKLTEALKKTPENFFVYKYNKDVYEQLLKIAEQYSNQDNPFAAYKNDFGFILKDGKVPVKTLRYYGPKLGVHLDISSKYTAPKNKVVMLQMQYLRIDVYKNEKGYRYVALPYKEFLPNGDVYIISKERYELLKRDAKIDESFEFCFSLYKYDEFKYKAVSRDKKEKEGDVIYIAVWNISQNNIEINFVDRKKEKQSDGVLSLGTVTELVKINTDVLGNKYYI
ncbi:MAG: type II CRISPR RNA-guided endonuclease Cas9, partial [Firmicutes bacterium]|nr:type II CRISPR RNA-guided endonuclease Cas9 [Bacillota bacterium]